MRRGDAHFLTDLVSLEAHVLAEHEDASRLRGQAPQAFFQGGEELFLRERRIRVGPRARKFMPMARAVEERIEVVLAVVAERRGARGFASIATNGIDDLVL